MGLIKDYSPPRKKVIPKEPEVKDPCDLCPINGEPQVLPKEVSKLNPVMFIGAYPGKEELEQGKPFSGKSGNLFHKVAYSVGFTPEDMCEANVLMCQPKKEVEDKEMKACGKYLTHYLKKVNPSLVVLMGELPLKYFFNRKSVTPVRGRVKVKGDYKFLITFNPAHIYREKEGSLDYRVFEQDLKHAYEIYTGVTRLTNKEYNLVKTNLDDLYKVIDHLSHFDVLSIDVESYAPEIKGSKEKTALDPYAEGFKIISISITGEENKAYCFLFEHPERTLDLEITKEKVRSLIENQAGKVGQSIKWDYKALGVHWGWRINNIIFDTEIASSTLDERKGIHNLDRLAMDWLGERSFKYEAHKIGREILPANELCVRNCTDADYTLRLYPLLKAALIKENLYDYYMEHRVPVISALAKIEMNGIPVDIEYTKNLTNEYSKRLEAIKGAIFRYPEVISIPDFNLNSNDDLQTLLFDNLKFETGRKTKTGFSTDKEVMDTLIKKYKHPLLTLIKDYAETQKFYGTYLEPVVTTHVKYDFRVHPTFTLHVAATGRLSCTRPNMQNIPAKDDDKTGKAKEIMNCYRAPEGFKIALADYKAIELRILAEYSKDPMLKYIFDNNIDPHQKTADECSKVAGTKLSRAAGKGLNFGIVYGETEFGLADALNVDRKVAKLYLDSYLKVYGGVKEYQDRTKAFLRQHGYVTTMFGRKRWIRLTGDEKKDEAAYRKAANTPIQGTAEGINTLSFRTLVNLYEKLGVKSMVISSIHDATMFQMHLDELEDLKDVTLYYMENLPIDFMTVTNLKVDWAEGNTWGECK